MPKSSARSGGRRGICRIDQPSTRTHGFFVRVGWYRRRNGSYGPRYQGFFGDVSHGGKRKALLAAEAFVRKIPKTAKKARVVKKAKVVKRAKAARKAKPKRAGRAKRR